MLAAQYGGPGHNGSKSGGLEKSSAHILYPSYKFGANGLTSCKFGANGQTTCPSHFSQQERGGDLRRHSSLSNMTLVTSVNTLFFAKH